MSKLSHEAGSNPRLSDGIVDAQGALRGPEADTPWRDVGAAYGLRRPEAWRGRCVVISADPRTFVAALLDLDGLASRIVLCPPDALEETIAWAAQTTGADAIVSDRVFATGRLGALAIAETGGRPPADAPRADQATEWVLFTSGTSGRPKLAVHSLDSLAGGLPSAKSSPCVWSTFYDIRRYGGLQILLRALRSGADFVLWGEDEPLAARLERMGRSGVTHLSGTPSHWRAVLMSPAADAISPRYIRLSGEIVDQAALDALAARFPQAEIVHAFASTEAGVAFEVRDGRAGAPAQTISASGAVQMKIVDGSLRIRSARCAARYLNADAPPLRDAEGFVDTGDILAAQGDRYVFLGRRGGIINIGGLKAHPEEIESVVNECSGVRASRVRARSNPILGSIVVADVILEGGKPASEEERSRAIRAIESHCRARLPAHKAPATIRIVEELEISPAGKLSRHG